MSTDGLGFSVGSQSQKVTINSDSEQKKGSVIGSMAVNVSLKSIDKATIDGSYVIVVKDIHVTTSDVAITVAENSRTDITSIATKLSGLTVIMGGTAGSDLDSIV
ncbi:MAG TPA: hypothetical protein ACHBX0_14560 [Arsenophonus sp.]